MLGKRPRPRLQSSFLLRDKCAEQIANAQVSGKHPYPPSSVPHHIVIGFDIEKEIKPYDACESPRSVLDANAPSLEKQATTRSLRSCLRTLPLREKGSQGVGLAVIVDIQAEEEEGSCLLPQAVSPCTWGPCQQRSQPIAIVAKSFVCGQLSAKKANKYTDLPPIHSQSELADSEDSLNLDFFGSDEASPWQECVLLNWRSCQVEADEDYVIRPPIFSVASAPSNCCSFDIQSVSFLDACAFCQRPCLPGKDIYMYRGDQAFCSAECRIKQIQIDESKETSVMASPLNHRGLLGYTHTFSHELGNMQRLV